MLSYVEGQAEQLFSPILDYMRESGGVRSSSEIHGYFKNQIQDEHLTIALEWLADKDILRKLPSPLHLTRKSQVTVDEAAYYLDE